MVGSKIPRGIQINANIIDTPAKVNATGKPTSKAAQIRISSRKGITSIFYKLVDTQKLKS